MANTKSAKKAARQGEARRQRNRVIVSSTRTYLKKARVAIEGQDSAQAQEAVQRAIVALDKAAEKGYLHKNNVARRKSRLMKHLNALTGQA